MIKEIYYILGSISLCLLITTKYCCKYIKNRNNNEELEDIYISIEELDNL